MTPLLTEAGSMPGTPLIAVATRAATPPSTAGFLAESSMTIGCRRPTMSPIMSPNSWCVSKAMPGTSFVIFFVTSSMTVQIGGRRAAGISRTKKSP